MQLIIIVKYINIISDSKKMLCMYCLLHIYEIKLLKNSCNNKRDDINLNFRGSRALTILFRVVVSNSLFLEERNNSERQYQCNIVHYCASRAALTE